MSAATVAVFLAPSLTLRGGSFAREWKAMAHSQIAFDLWLQTEGSGTSVTSSAYGCDWRTGESGAPTVEGTWGKWSIAPGLPSAWSERPAPAAGPQQGGPPVQQPTRTRLPYRAQRAP